MSEDNIAVHPVFFKEIRSRVNRLGHIIDQLDILVYYFKQLEDPLEKFFTISFELRQEYFFLQEVCQKAASRM